MLKKLLFAFLTVLVTLSLFPATALAKDQLKNTDPDKYYILLDLRNQFGTVYEKDKDGKYTKIVRRFLCSTGKDAPDPLPFPEEPDNPANLGTPTPTGIWRIGGRERFGKFVEFSDCARYWTQIVADNYFHSILFNGKDINKLTSGSFSGLGTKKSHGCVRLYVEDAKWLYYYACPGTIVKVSETEKAQTAIRNAMKIASFSEYNAMQKKIYDEAPLPDPTVWVAVDGARIKTGNAASNGTVATLKAGTEVTLIQDGDPWVKVKYNGREGYMLLAHITTEKGVMQSKADADIVSPDTEWIYDQKLEKKDKPSEHYVIKVPYDSSVKVLESSDGWTKIDYFGHVGWLKSSSLKKGWGTIRQ